MADRAELVEAALEVYPEGLALLDEADRVVFWNHAAEIITGHPNAGIIGRELPQGLEPLTACGLFERSELLMAPASSPLLARGTLVHAQHKQGHDIPAITRRLVLRDPLGGRIGTAMVFHPSEHANALPHGDTSEGSEVRASQAELRDHLETEYERFVHEAVPLGLLWITVDQAESMRKTHGARACEAMLENVERTLANHLRAGEEVGRWGDGEFLVLSHEASGEVLANHAQLLAGLARTADFRWWGDRLTLTVSVGASKAEPGEALAEVLNRAREGMETSAHAGGNRVTWAPGRFACSRS
ncbi:sensor domain-containing diguanylate cyclase [Occallatibacter riparius]|uniref:Diguanylate cyclase n=1 Tax=Occallatibacter riparius TaxID=1002689 RepID=A0A9J7BG25_9BACT|nr:diguanylate cyclase [Occallatibacter riparius]UWZ81956.1 diguanylate cyclase [Occallatibacter riparius]